MLKLRSLYRSFYLKKSYGDIDEEKILSSLYTYKTGTIEEVMSRLINEAVLKHMDLTIDSTIMQLVALNQYLSRLFLDNLELLIFNYFMAYLEDKKIEEINETIVSELEHLAKSVDMKISLEELILELERICKVQNELKNI